MYEYCVDFNEKYVSFVNSLKQPLTYKSVDFLGLNLYEGQSDPVFKVYYANKFSSGSDHPLITFLSEKGMLRYFEMVKDTLRPSSIRMDIALKKRTDSNMEALFSYLRQMTPLFSESEAKLRRMAHMKITEMPQHSLASMYHLGFVQDGDQTRLLKYYVFTRWCPNPDEPNTGSEFRDEEYLDVLCNCGIEEFKKLSAVTKAVLEKCGGHLWMAGMDVGENGYRRFKLYVKNPEHVYEQFMEIFEGDMRDKLQRTVEWNLKHPELEFEAVAFALDSEDIFSMSLYYGWNEIENK